MRFERVYQWLLLAPVILPLVVWSGLVYPYLVPKTLLFYAVMLISLAMFLIRLTRGIFYWGRLRAWETWSPALLLVLAYGTSVVGIDFYRSFWSIFVRGDGLLMLTGVVTSFYLIVLSADSHFFTRFVRSVAVIGTLVAGYGIGEWLLGGGRIGSLLGNAAFFAGYMGLTCFVTLMAAQSLTGVWRRVALGGVVLQICASILTATRGTILALGVALCVYLVYTAFQKNGKLTRVSRFLLGMLLVLSGIGIAFRTQLAHVPFAPLARIASVSTTESDVASRLFVWKNMLQEVAQNPLSGVGAEHISVLFNRFYDPTLIVEQWFDRSHNAFLDYTAQYGVGGLLLYCVLIASFFSVAVRLVRRNTLQTGLCVGLLTVTYAVQNFFVFDTISSFWLFVALLAVCISRVDTQSQAEALPLSTWMKPASWGIAAVLIACIYPVSILPAEAAYDLAHAYTYQLADVSKATAYLAHGFALGTYADLEYGYMVYEMYTSTQSVQLTGDARVMAYRAARSLLATNFERYTYDARTALYFANVLALTPPDVEGDAELLSAALERAIRLSPKRSQPWYILANLSINNANRYPAHSDERSAGYAAAREILTHYIATVPTLATPHFVLAQLLLATGDTSGASHEAEQGRLVYSSSLEAATRAAAYYETVGDLTNAAFFLREVLRYDPTNTGAQEDLKNIAAYEQSKN